MAIVSKRKKESIKNNNNNYCDGTICTVLEIIIHLVMDFESVLQNWVVNN